MPETVEIDGEQYVKVVLCSDFNEEISLGCDLPEGHEGPHMARVVWSGGDEDA